MSDLRRHLPPRASDICPALLVERNDCYEMPQGESRRVGRPTVVLPEARSGSKTSPAYRWSEGARAGELTIEAKATQALSRKRSDSHIAFIAGFTRTCSSISAQ